MTRRAKALKEVVVRAPDLAPFVANVHGMKSTDVFFHMDSGERRNVPSGTGVHQGDALRPVLFCVPGGESPSKTANAI